MRVKYIVKDIHQRLKDGITENEKKYYERWSILPENFSFSYGNEYFVYGIDYVNSGQINLMLCDDDDLLYYDFFPIEFFEVVDNRLSKFWQKKYGEYYPLDIQEYPLFVTCKEIIGYKYFFDELLNGKKSTQQIFYKTKLEIENEFPDKNVETAMIIDNNWLECSYCSEIWENKSKEGVLICPKCKQRNNNPTFLNVDINY